VVSVNWTEETLKKLREQENMKAQQQAQCGQAIGGAMGCDTQPRARRSSLREEAEQQASQHLEQADKKARAATFFREHPEFDEFIQLIHSGVIGI